MRRWELAWGVLLLLSPAWSQDLRWRPGKVFQYLRALDTVVQKKGLVLQTLWAVPSEARCSLSQEDLLSFCHSRGIPPPYNLEQGKAWLDSMHGQFPYLCLLKELIKYYDEKIGKLVTVGPLRRSDPWVLAFLLSGLNEGYMPDGREGPAGLWAMLPSRARVYGLSVRPTYDERLWVAASFHALQRLLKDAGDHLPQTLAHVVWGPREATNFKIPGQDPAKMSKLYEPYDMWVVLEYALSNCSECPARMVIPEIQTRELLLRPEHLPLCMNLVSEALHVSESLLVILNPHWITPCQEPYGASPVRLRIPVQWSENLTEVLSLLSQRSDSLLRTQRTADGLAPHAATMEKQAPYHTVKRGESLSLIARKYGLSITQLKAMNHLRTDLLRPGQKLLVKPTPPVFSSNYPTDLSARLRGAEVLDFPEMPPSIPQAPRKFHPQHKRAFRVHIVKSGETLGSIARRYRITVAAIRKANRLKGDLIKAGQKLRIP